jgi:hypothetical protein
MARQMGFAVVCLNRSASVGNEPVGWFANYFNKNRNIDMGFNPPQEVGNNYGRFKYPPTDVGLFRVNAHSSGCLFVVPCLKLRNSNPGNEATGL